MDASVVSCGDASPVLAPAEHAFDEISCLVEFGIVVDRLVAVGAAGDAGFDSAVGKSIVKPVAVVAFVGDRGLGVRQQREQRLGSRRPDPSVGRRTKALPSQTPVELRAEPTPDGAVDTARKSLFLRRLAAVRCAFGCVVSIIDVPLAAVFAAGAAKMRLKMPALLQRTNRL